MNYKRLTPLVTLAITTLLALAAIPAFAEPAGFPSHVLNGIDALQKLPAEGFHVVESQGRTLLVSTNGHYVVLGGRILDLWNQVEIRRVADVPKTQRIPLNRLRLDLDDLGGVTIGDGPQVVVFLDPLSKETPRLLEEIRALQSAYQFRLVFMPARADRRRTSQARACSPADARRFIHTGETPKSIPGDPGCGKAPLQKTLVTASLLGIKSVPFTIAPNGATIQGHSANYRGFLEENRHSIP